jgi:hypothetical protein
MILATDFSVPKGIDITNEASQKLVEIILQIQNGLIKSWSSLPPHLQCLFKFAKIKLDLQDNSHDQVMIDIRIAKTFETDHTITKFKETGFVFRVECLAPDIEKTIDEGFKKVTLVLINRISEDIKDIFESLQKDALQYQ